MFNQVEEIVSIPPVWQRLDLVEQRLHEVTESLDPFLTKIARHLLAAGGKRFRPLLAQITAELGPSIDQRAVEAGIAVELIHLGSLYHDDVIDESDLRRGAASANAAWGNTVAILAGDFVLARASEVAAASLGSEAVVLLAQTYAQLCEGQVGELQLTDDLLHGAREYFRVIESKTASLIRTAARLGAMASDAPPATVEAVSDWGWEVGTAFQVIDDVLDLVGSSDALGKPTGSDIAEGTFTLPVILALRGPEGGKLEALLAEGRPRPPEVVERAISMVREGGYIETAIEQANHHIQRARAALKPLPPAPATQVLDALARHLLAQVPV